MDARAHESARQEQRALAERIDALEADADEHRLVLAALSPLAAARRCYRRVGGVLVETSVGQTAPVLEENLRGIERTLEGLRGAHARLEERLSRSEERE